MPTSSDRLLRLAAEMENLRKRMEREIADTRSYAITKFARDMLTATDSSTAPCWCCRPKRASRPTAR